MYTMPIGEELTPRLRLERQSGFFGEGLDAADAPLEPVAGGVAGSSAESGGLQVRGLQASTRPLGLTPGSMVHNILARQRAARERLAREGAAAAASDDSGEDDYDDGAGGGGGYDSSDDEAIFFSTKRLVNEAFLIEVQTVAAL